MKKGVKKLVSHEGLRAGVDTIGLDKCDRSYMELVLYTGALYCTV